MITRRQKSRRSQRPQGFTLLELLLAVVVFSILLTAINAVLFSGMKMRNVTTEAVERSQPLERTMSVIKHDLANIVLPGGIMTGTLQTTPLGNNIQPDGTSGPSIPQQTSLLNPTASGMPGQSSPLFYVSTGIVDESTPFTDIAQVYYYLATPTNSATPGLDLYRSVTCNLLAVMPETPANQYLMSGVQSISFSYYVQSATQVGQWLDYWDSTNPDLITGQSNNVPRAIKVELQMVSTSGGANAPVNLVVPVMVQSSTNESSTISSNLTAQVTRGVP